MAANYKVNIELDTSKLDAQLKDLGVKVDAVGKTRAGTAKKVQSAEEKAAASANKELTLQNSIEATRARQIKLSKKSVEVGGDLVALGRQVNADNIQQIKQTKLQTDLEIKQANNKLALEKKILKGQETLNGQRSEAATNIKVELDRRAKQEKALQDSLGAMDKKSAKAAKQRRMDLKHSKSLGKDIVKLKIKEVEAEKKISDAQRDRFLRGSTMRGPDGKKVTASNYGPQLPAAAKGIFSGFNRGAALSSATISGAFPLLFGQGPVSALGGAVGGGLGGGLGGQMGGFAGGLAGTTIATGVAQFTASVTDLGKALNENTKDVGALSEALGITGTEFEKNLKTLEKLGGEEAAFEAARSKMINLVGQKGVDALSKFGEGATELANQFTIAMTQMKASFASAFGNTGVGQGISNRLKAANLQRQAAVSTDPEVIKARKLATGLGKGAMWRTKEERELIRANPGVSWDQAKKGVETAQVAANERSDKAAQEKILADIQAQRVENIDKEIALLERGAGMSVMEFEIETKIMEIKKEGAIQDEDAIRSKLEKLYKLQEERDAIEKINGLYKDIGSTIKDGMLEGINAVIDGTKTLGDVASNVLRQISNKLISFGLDTILGGIPGLGSLFKADGGPVKGGSSYIVGERGPELFVPGSSGNIVPNHKLGKGGSTSIVVNVDASGSEVEGSEEDSRELGNMLASAIQTELIRQKRPGGLLA